MKALPRLAPLISATDVEKLRRAHTIIEGASLLLRTAIDSVQSLDTKLWETSFMRDQLTLALRALDDVQETATYCAAEYSK